jgi:hypothetical protein
MLNKEQIVELRELEKKYDTSPGHGDTCYICKNLACLEPDQTDDFLADPVCDSCWRDFGEPVREFLPALLDEIEALRQFRDRVNAYVIPGVADTGEAMEKIVREHTRYREALEKIADPTLNIWARPFANEALGKE